MTLPLRGATDGAPYTGRKLLKRGLVLVQFSPVLRIAADTTGAGIAPFQEEVRQEYPNLEMELEQLLQVELKPDVGFQPVFKQLPVWRLSDLSRIWRVSLTQESVSLEVAGEGYTDSEDFAQRMQRIVSAVQRHFDPAESRRIGVRFLNAAPTDGSEDPRHQCAKELVSITGEKGLLVSDLLWRFEADEGELILRSGVSAPNTTHDPAVLPAESVRRWYLDIDVVNHASTPFKDVLVINESILAQVRRVHAIYKWAMPNSVKASA